MGWKVLRRSPRQPKFRWPSQFSQVTFQIQSSLNKSKLVVYRFVGAPDGYKYSTINLYEYEFYMGLEQYSYGDASSLNYDNLGRSAIVTGCDPWTLYEYNNYQGRCACVYPSDSNNCYPGFYKNLGNVANQVSSARKGCYCNKKLAPEPTLTRSSTVGASAYFPGN